MNIQSGDGQATLFDTWRFHAFFTTSDLDTVTANAAWLVLAVMAFNLTRAAESITGNGLARATTVTIRRKLHLPKDWP